MYTVDQNIIGAPKIRNLNNRASIAIFHYIKNFYKDDDIYNILR